MIEFEEANMASVERFNRVIKRNDDWYVETDASLEGPFFELNKAREFQALLIKAEMARMEFAALLEQ